MGRVIWIVVVAAITIYLAWQLSILPGTVTVSLSGYTVQTATSLAVVAVVLIVVALVLLLRLVGWVWHTPGRVGFWRGRRQRRGGDEAVTRTLVAIAAGADTQARRESARARRLLGDTPQTLLLAAEAGRLANREEEASELYSVLAKRNDSALLGLRGLFRQAMNREAWSEAAAIAERAETVHPGGAWLREERAQLAVRTGNWQQALRLAGPESPRAAFATAAADAEPNPEQALRMAKRAWQDNPGYSPAALSYARHLRAAGRDVKALRTIRAAWTANPQPELAAFSLAPIDDPEARMREASRLVSYNPNHPESLYLMAMQNWQIGQLPETRTCLEEAQRQGINQRRFWLLLADLELAERGDSEAGRLAQRDALRRAAVADADPVWRCDACGTEHAAWRPVCPTCHTAGKIVWHTRSMALVAAAD
jgi:HemY protein